MILKYQVTRTQRIKKQKTTKTELIYIILDSTYTYMPTVFAFGLVISKTNSNISLAVKRSVTKLYRIN